MCPSAVAAKKGVLAFLAQDADKRVFCYATAVSKEDQNDEILRFIEYWKAHGAFTRRTGLRLQAHHLWPLMGT
jgi:hypothetical protein